MSGALVFGTAAKALADARPAVARGEVTQLDLAGVAASDSAGLAVLLALRRAAGLHGTELTITSLPATLRALAQLGEVEDLLGMADSKPAAA
ncbi:MAG: STAS domain-containing protein [Rhodanobacteraceae bacterium]|nr:STAS domain-containing protein [Rhodanobacteraceae bacterium]